MIVRPVHVHQPFPNPAERGERRGRTVDELAICPRTGERAFEDQLIFRARFKAVFIQKVFQGRAKFFNIKQGLNRAAFFAAANERAVGAFAQHQIERAQNDGFARTGFTRDDVATRLEFQRQVAYQSQIFDAQRRQHF